MESVRERFTRAERRAALGDAYLACPIRGAVLGERACKKCGGQKLQPLYACALHPKGVVISEECQACHDVPAAAACAGVDALASRKQICLACDEHYLAEGRLRCGICNCEEPFVTRPYCPVKKWGLDEWTRQKADYDSQIKAQSDEATSLWVIIPTFNEGERLHQTLRTLWTSAGSIQGIVLMDDGSTDGSVDALIPPKMLKAKPQARSYDINRYGMRLVILRQGRQGVGCSRHVGGNFAVEMGATHLAFMDSHIIVQPFSLMCLAQIATERQGIVQAGCRSWALNNNGWTRYGGRLGVNAERVLGVSYIKEAPSEAVSQVPALIGACYVMTAREWSRLGGWLRNTGIWGFNEQLLSIKSFFAGIPLFAHRDIAAQHYFKKKEEGISCSNDEFWKSRYAVLKICFGAESFERVWLPELRRRYSSPAMEDFLASPQVQAEHEAFQALKVRTDAEFFSEMLPGTVYATAFAGQTPAPAAFESVTPEVDPGEERFINCPVRVAQHKSEAIAAYQEIARVEPSVFLEVGSCLGGTAWTYGGACRKGATIILVDLCGRSTRNQLFATVAAIKTEGYDVHLVRGDSRAPATVAAVEKILGERRVDVLHIDADHSYEAVKEDYDHYARLVRENGLILLHDINTHRESVGVPKFWAEIRPGKRNLEIIHGREKGIGILYV